MSLGVGRVGHDTLLVVGVHAAGELLLQGVRELLDLPDLPEGGGLVRNSQEQARRRRSVVAFQELEIQEYTIRRRRKEIWSKISGVRYLE